MFEHNKNFLNNKRGVSLAEILIIVAVTGILATITISAFINLNNKEALEKEPNAEELLDEIGGILDN